MNPLDIKATRSSVKSVIAKQVDGPFGVSEKHFDVIKATYQIKRIILLTHYLAT